MAAAVRAAPAVCDGRHVYLWVVDRSRNVAGAPDAHLIAGCTINLAVLFVFKYFDFLNTQTRDLMALIGVDNNVPNIDLILPVAISFYMFQCSQLSVRCVSP